MKTKAFILLMLLTLMASSLPVYADGVLTDELARQVKAGMTREEVRGLLGEPAKISEKKDGSQVWTYKRREESVRPPQADLPKPMPDKSRLELGVRVTFNAEGIAERVQQRILEEERTSRVVSDEQFEAEMGS